MKRGQSERRRNEVDEEATAQEETEAKGEREVRSRLPLLPIHTPP